MTFMEDYMRGLNSLFMSASAFASLAQSLGKPFENSNIPSARVSFDDETKLISFEINPEYIASLSDGEVAAVIAHETYHVLLSHFDEQMDLKSYPDRHALMIAQECIINDGMFANVGFHLPEGTCSGPKDHNQDFSWFTTKNGYDFLLKPQDENPEPEDNDSQDKDASSSNEESTPPKDDSSKDNSDQDETTTDASDGSEDVEDNSESDDEPSDDPDNESEIDDEEEDDSSESNPSGISCGGMVIKEEDLKEFKEAISDAINEAMKDFKPGQVPDDVSDILENLSSDESIDIDTSAWSINSVDKSGSFLDTSDTLELNWKSLLAKINPAIMSSQKPVYRDAWHKPRRKMLNSYPEIILPTSRRVDNTDGKGSEVPTVILALDMSVSIPTYLIAKLASLADSIPKDIITPVPVTWSDSVQEFDTSTRKIVSRGGTNIDKVLIYADNYEKKNKVKPYVLVITDGQCSFSNWQLKRTSVDHKALNERWIWMGIERKHKNTIQNNFGRHIDRHEIYCMQDFL